MIMGVISASISPAIRKRGASPTTTYTVCRRVLDKYPSESSDPIPTSDIGSSATRSAPVNRLRPAYPSLIPIDPAKMKEGISIKPWGRIEIPSFILAGSIGIKLGYAGLRRFTGAERVADDPMSDVGIGSADSDGYLSRTLRQTVYVVVGLAPLFLIAGLIEADITPIIMRLF